MSKSTIIGVVGAGVLLSSLLGVVRAQTPSPEDAAIAQIQTLTTINSADQRRIADWVQNRVGELRQAVRQTPKAGVRPFIERVKSLYENSTNTREFRVQMARQTAGIAEREFAKADLAPAISQAMARVLVDMDTAETYPGLIAGLKSQDRSTRYVCVRGLVTQKTFFAADQDRLNRTVAALRDAGVAENDPVVLSSVYQTLALPNQVDAVFDAYMALFDRRIESRRASKVVVDRAELDAFDYFRVPAVIGALSPERKSALAARLAVFLRLDAERYNTEEVGLDEHFGECDNLERRIDGVESCLEALIGAGRGGDIRGELRAGGYQQRDAVLQQAYRWVGNPATQQAGALNAAPWNVPTGAP